MERDEFVRRYPRIYHVTEAGAWASISRHGLFSTSALLDLFEVSEPRRGQLEACPRPDSITITHPRRGRAVLRDNRPLRIDILQRCLDGPVADWCRILNARVFFWATEARLRTHLRARGHRGQPRDVIVADTCRLLEAHYDAVTLCAFNSGSALYPNAPRRGPGSFLPIHDYPYETWRRKRGAGDAVVEVCVSPSIPAVAEVVEAVWSVHPDGSHTSIALDGGNP